MMQYGRHIGGKNDYHQSKLFDFNWGPTISYTCCVLFGVHVPASALYVHSHTPRIIYSDVSIFLCSIY